MYLLGLGLILMALKYFEIGPVANWAWWWVLSPLAGAVLWWTWADWSGYTKRKAEEKMERRRLERIEKHNDTLRAGTRRR